MGFWASHVVFTFLCPSTIFRSKLPTNQHARNASAPHLWGQKNSKGRCSMRLTPVELFNDFGINDYGVTDTDLPLLIPY